MSQERVSVEQARKMSKEEQEELLGKIEQAGHDNEVKYWNCAQAVVAALQQYLDVPDGGIFKAASCFTGCGRYIYEPIDEGFAIGSEECGSLCGGIMIIGAIYGRGKYVEGLTAHEQANYMEAILRSRTLYHKFHRKFGSIRCGDVRMSVRPPDWRIFKSHDTAFAVEDHDVCGKVCGPSARMAAEVILEPTESFKATIDREMEVVGKAQELKRKSQSK